MSYRKIESGVLARVLAPSSKSLTSQTREEKQIKLTIILVICYLSLGISSEIENLARTAIRKTFIPIRINKLNIQNEQQHIVFDEVDHLPAELLWVYWKKPVSN